MSDMTFRRMSEVIKAFEQELSDRNPIGVNLYTPYLALAAAKMEEIHQAELTNPTCDNAGFRDNDSHAICSLIPMQNACNKCVGLEYRRRLDMLAKVTFAPNAHKKAHKKGGK